MPDAELALTAAPPPGFFRIALDGDSLWQEVFDAFDPSEQTCIREEFGEESLASLLDRPVLEELEEEDEVLLRLFGCLGPESAISLSCSGFVASTAAESPNLAGPVQACLSQSLAGVAESSNTAGRYLRDRPPSDQCLTTT